MTRGWAGKYCNRQFIRYLIVGAWNTLFGYGVYALFTWILTDKIPYAYMAASVIGTVVSITNAYVGYKLFVFKTKGNYLREYLRFYVVYGAAALVNLSLLPIAVYLFGHIVSKYSAPYVAGASLMSLTIVFSFFGHRNFSFKVRS
ncbi:MAG: GtrA family protein [Armatimonadota bacterium]|nr:GtrA family protein [Armatimonadota bacterium]